MTKKEREKYFNPDGSIKRLLEVVEILPDGTRVFENGWKAAPSKVDYGNGNVVRIDSMTSQEQQKWESDLMKHVGEGMSAYYQSRIIST